MKFRKSADAIYKTEYHLVWIAAPSPDRGLEFYAAEE
jgi:hypothetical protein